MSKKRPQVASVAKRAAAEAVAEERRQAYKKKAIPIDPQARLTTETRRQADLAFESRIRQAASFKPRKVPEKQAYFQHLFHAGKRAHYHNGCVAYQRRLQHPDCSKAKLQVVAAAVEAGYFKEHRSLPGSPQMSRLQPTDELVEHAMVDPWTFDPNTTKQLVILRDRKTKHEMPFDPTLPIPAETQQRLELVNKVNREFEIAYLMFDQWQGVPTHLRRLRPVHYAVFNGSFDLVFLATKLALNSSCVLC